jgi:tetratricopeptide (TPR) repeat protein
MARMRDHHFEEALVVLEQALSLDLIAGYGPGMVEAGRLLARCLGACGRLDEALVRGRAALAAADALGDPVARAEVLLVLGGLQQRAGRLADAERLCSGAAGILLEAGHRARAAEAWLVVAEVRRRGGDLDGAYALLERSRATWAESGSLYVGTADVNLALIDIERGRFQAAAARLVEAISLPEYEADRIVAYAGRVLLVHALAGLGRWAESGEVLDDVESQDPVLASVETAGAVEEAGDAAARDDRREFAVRCWKQALLQWKKLNLRGPSLRVAVKLEEISP